LECVNVHDQQKSCVTHDVPFFSRWSEDFGGFLWGAFKMLHLLHQKTMLVFLKNAIRDLQTSPEGVKNWAEKGGQRAGLAERGNSRGSFM
jgi:hypothetical protein